jgi:hypothetical protein
MSDDRQMNLPMIGASMKKSILYRFAGAVAMLAAMSVPGAAQSTSQGAGRATGDTTGAIRSPDGRAASQKPAAKPATRRAAAPRNSDQYRAPLVTDAATRAWTLDQALPGKPSAYSDAPASRPQFGRVPLESGSLGLETKTQLRDNEFADGRKVPGLETTKRNEPSYFGLSLSVPANDPGFFRLPRLD